MEVCIECGKLILNPQEAHQHHGGFCPYKDGGPCTCDGGAIHNECCEKAKAFMHKLERAQWN